jgi:DHA2 family multidrug resistance protein-like MFS transporter
VVGIVSAVFYAGLAVLAIRAFKHVPKATGDDTTNADRETDRVPEAA